MAQTKVKKPEICMYWWEKVVEVEPTHDEALTELAKLYERNKDWGKLAEVELAQADNAPTTRPRRRAAAPRPALHREGRGHLGRRSPRGSGCSRSTRTTAAPRTRSRSCTSGRPLGRPRGVLPHPRQARRVRPRARARGRGRPRAAPAGAGRQDRGAVPRRAGQARSRDARLREGAVARREEPGRRRGADPAVRGGPRSQEAGRRARDPAGVRPPTTTCARSASSAWPSTTRRSCATRARRSAGGSRPTPRITRRSGSAPSSSGWPRTPARGRSWSTRTAPRCPSSAHKSTRCR
jgi:hypothetical protein